VLPKGCVLDGEIVVVSSKGLDFDALQQRIHPAASRITKLAQQTPASFVAFDLLAAGGKSTMDLPQGERRVRLERLIGSARPPLHLTPMTRDREEAERWLHEFEGAGLDGVIAKLESAPYQPGKRAMLKIKHMRSADCVVAGFRWYKDRDDAVGSLLLGLYDADGHLQHVGVSAAFSAARRAAMVAELEPLRLDPADLAGHPWGGELAEGLAEDRRPGAQSRWNAGKDLSWVPLQPALVLEVGYDHMEGTRFRHTAQFKRWRTDRDPESCTYEQLEEPVSYDLRTVLGTVRH